ncbi:MAG: hypothetical protein P9L99_04570 [Candidatus Lernaella stagnicola]|nr:hypothetical protein [Candidatus Lernaella stagnicola]
MSTDCADRSLGAWAAFALITLYTALMIGAALALPAEKVRYFFTDINGPAHLSHWVFYGINTTLAVFLEWTTALLFAVRLFMLGDDDDTRRATRFFLGQIVLFAFLGADDRFLIHERLEELYGIDDFLTLGALGAVELLLLATWGREQWRPRPARNSLVAAGGFFAVMLLVDKFGPDASSLRLAIEDLCKLWSAFFLARFAWLVCRSTLSHRRSNAQT